MSAAEGPIADPGLDVPTLVESPALRTRHRSAWLVSLVAHVILFTLAGLLIRAVPRGASDEPGRTTGIVLAKVSANATEYFSEADTVVESTTTESASAAAAAALAEAQRPDLPSIAGLLPTLPTGGSGGTDGSGTVVDATSLLDGDGFDGSVGRPTTTQVFGVQGTGSRFVYVFDRSSSMEGFGGLPLEQAKRELIGSLKSLRGTNEFQIVFYNERPTVFTIGAGPATMMFADDRNKEAAASFVGSIRGRGATRHLEALELALRMGPDVVFFLTDAAEPELTDEELALVDRWNRNAASIHTIEFGVGPQRRGVNFLQKLADRNSGQYVYRDVTKFGDK